MVTRVLLFLALLPALLIGPFACFCASHTAVQPLAISQMSAGHECCAEIAEPSAPTRAALAPGAAELPPGHTSDCPHCTGVSQLRAAEIAPVAPAAALQPPAEVALPAFLADVLALSAPRPHGQAPPSSRPPLPPPDLLRVKCTLVI